MIAIARSGAPLLRSNSVRRATHPRDRPTRRAFYARDRTAARLQQANIVPVLTAGTSGGVPYYTMPFVKANGCALPEGSPFAARAMFVDNDARTLAREILAMEPADYAAAFKGSAVKRAKLWMLQRNAAVVLENGRT